MSPALLLLLVAVGMLALAAGIIVWSRRGAPADPDEVRDLAPPEPTSEDRYARRHEESMLVEPPTVLTRSGEVTLRDWLLYFSGHELAWPRVVTTFYERAQANPKITDYFRGEDLAKLQRHFVATLVLFTDSGLSVGALRAMRSGHESVRNSRGEPITGEVYDAVIDTLVDVLRAEGVANETIDALTAIARPLREAIAVR